MSGHVGEGSSILPVLLWDYVEPPEFHRVMPPLYAGSWVAIEVAGMDLGNLDLGTDYHPLTWRDGLDPVLYDWVARYGPGDIRPADPDGPPPPPGSIDYVLLIGPLEPGRVDSAFHQWLESDYEHVFTSEPSGLANLYRFKG